MYHRHFTMYDRHLTEDLYNDAKASLEELATHKQNLLEYVRQTFDLIKQAGNDPDYTQLEDIEQAFDEAVAKDVLRYEQEAEDANTYLENRFERQERTYGY